MAWDPAVPRFRRVLVRRPRTGDVDGATHEMLVLDLDSPDMPAGVVSPPLLAVGSIDAVELAAISDTSGVELAFTRVPIGDFVPATAESTPRPTGTPESTTLGA